WTYARTQINYPTEANHWSTKITTPPDPTVGNDTVIDFQKDSATTAPTNNFYETQRVNYQGAQGSNVILQTVATCYNTNTTNCPTTAVSSPITQISAIVQLDTSGLQSKNVT